MKLDLLEKGLRLLILNENDTAEAKQALAELNEIQQRVGRQDIYKGDCFVLHAATVDDLLNIATYDAYGEIYAKMHRIGHEVSFGDYEKVCREQYGLEYAPLSAIQVGFDVIGDLYRDNEEQGCHKPDGTFRHLKDEENAKTINAAIERLQAYYDCNHEYMDADDLGNLLTIIDSLKAMI